jgi:hypothetical protein
MARHAGCPTTRKLDMTDLTRGKRYITRAIISCIAIETDRVGAPIVSITAFRQGESPIHTSIFGEQAQTFLDAHRSGERFVFHVMPQPPQRRCVMAKQHH